MVDMVVQRLVSLDTAFFNAADLCQLHQFFLSCSLKMRLQVQGGTREGDVIST
jgi:hypothetical protein